LQSVSFVNGDTGTAAGRSTILRTTNAGTTWITLPFVPPNPYFSILSVALADAQTGSLFGVTPGSHPPYCSGMYPCYSVLRTTDGEATWRDIGVNGGINRASFASSLFGAGVSTSCTIRLCLTTIWGTTDGGATWTRQFGQQSGPPFFVLRD